MHGMKFQYGPNAVEYGYGPLMFNVSQEMTGAMIVDLIHENSLKLGVSSENLDGKLGFD